LSEIQPMYEVIKKLTKHKMTEEHWFFCAIGFYNEADTLKSSSILMYSQSMAGLYAQ